MLVSFRGRSLLPARSSSLHCQDRNSARDLAHDFGTDFDLDKIFFRSSRTKRLKGIPAKGTNLATPKAMNNPWPKTFGLLRRKVQGNRDTFEKMKWEERFAAMSFAGFSTPAQRDDGIAIFQEICDKKWIDPLIIKFRNRLLQDCCRSKSVESAEKVATMIAGSPTGMTWYDYRHLFDMCIALKDVDRAERYAREARSARDLQKMTDETPFYNGLIRVFAQCNDLYRANLVLLEVDQQKFKPNQETFRCLLDACKTFDQIDDVLMNMHATSFRMGVETQRSLVRAYFRVDRADLAVDIYREEVAPHLTKEGHREFIQSIFRSTLKNPNNLDLVKTFYEYALSSFLV